MRPRKIIPASLSVPASPEPPTPGVVLRYRSSASVRCALQILTLSPPGETPCWGPDANDAADDHTAAAAIRARMTTPPVIEGAQGGAQSNPRRRPIPSAAAPGEVEGGRYAFASFFPPMERLILRGCTSGFFGMTTERTPSLSSAETWSASTPSGSVNVRENAPYARS